MARLFDKGAEDDGAKCAVRSCRHEKPTLYDERTELYYCDDVCFENYMVENIYDVLDWYAGINLYDIS